MTTLTPALRDAAMRWIADDPDPDDSAELQRILVAAMTGTATDELADRMNTPLRFGTAGIRAPMRAGPAGMNRAVVIRTSAGVAAWLASHGEPGPVVIGRDARHRSEVFATDAAEVFSAAGFDTIVLSEPLPTPVLAFAVRHLGAIAGVQLTASHNRPGDNGYKLYLADGAPLAPPDDAAVEATIATTVAAVSVPRSAGWRPADPGLLDAYLTRAAGVARGEPGRGLRIAVTPVHGVGGRPLVAALSRAGFDDVRLVDSQAEPDPDFPTVRSPNPEEPDTVAAVLALAVDSGANLAIALDPDADRCALGVPGRDGRWRMLTGDETGALLGSYLLSTLDRNVHPDPLVATSMVSSSLLRAVAEAHSAQYAETPTGFKWLTHAGDDLVYAYEEALGYCVDPDVVRDKDGISAAVLASDLAAGLAAAGRTMLDALDELAVAHGVHLTEQLTQRFDDQHAAAAVMTRLRTTLPELPLPAEDLARRPDDPSNAIRLGEPSTRVMIRPSGTEPKLKAYLEVVEPVADAAAIETARARAAERMASLRELTTPLLAAPDSG